MSELDGIFEDIMEVWGEHDAHISHNVDRERFTRYTLTQQIRVTISEYCEVELEKGRRFSSESKYLEERPDGSIVHFIDSDMGIGIRIPPDSYVKETVERTKHTLVVEEVISI